jgi:hypothetical protein
MKGRARLMRIVRFLRAGVFLLGPALGSLSLMSGCGGPPVTGTQAQVDEAAKKEQEDIQKAQREYMERQKAGGATKKSP